MLEGEVTLKSSYIGQIEGEYLVNKDKISML